METDDLETENRVTHQVSGTGQRNPSGGWVELAERSLETGGRRRLKLLTEGFLPTVSCVSMQLKMKDSKQLSGALWERRGSNPAETSAAASVRPNKSKYRSILDEHA